MKLQSLGTISGSATSGLAITGGTNATPIVATITTGHGLKNGDRIHISGVTGNTGMNGEWELEFVTDTTVRLLGSKGNGTYGGTPVVNVVCKKTPFMPRHSGVAMVLGGTLTAGTIEIEGHPGNESSAGVLDTGSWVKASKSNVVGMPVYGGGCAVEVQLYPYMRVKAVSALTGSAQVGILV
jgi:hypothetical protein